jgi:hypothetical protein
MENLKPSIFFFLILVLSSLLVGSVSAETTETTGLNLSPGSEVPMGEVEAFNIKIIYYSIIPVLDTWEPISVKWELINANGETAYIASGEVLDAISRGGTPPVGLIPGYANWDVYIKNPHLQIPAFATPGAWRLKLVICDTGLILGWEQKCVDVAYWSMIVKEGSVWDHLMAPIYVHVDKFLGVFGGLDFAIPCIILLTSPAWICILAIVVIRVWKAGIGGGFEILRKGGTIRNVEKKK